MTQLVIILELLATIAVLALIARRVHIPLPILLVSTGTILGFIPGLPKMELSPDLVFFIFLPPLLYFQACLTSWRDFKKYAESISFLAIGLVLVTAVCVAAVAHALIPDLSWPAAFVLGAIVSPTDAVAATSIAQSLGVPRSIISIVEGESLVNDATGLVMYRLTVAAVLTGIFSLTHFAWELLYMGVGGILVGLAMGWLLANIRYRLNDTPVEITISLLSPFLIFLPTEILHVSGVLAVVTAGLYLGWHGPEMMNSTTRVTWLANWSTITFLLNGMVFLLIGLQLSSILSGLSHYSSGQLIGWAIAISATTILTRLLWTLVGGQAKHILRPKEKRVILPWRHRVLIGWSGMRGVVSLAAALALPLVLPSGEAFPFRSLLIYLTFCVIIATLILQGLTLAPLIRLLKVRDDGLLDREELETRIKMARAAIARLEQLSTGNDINMDIETIERLRDYYRVRIIHYTNRFHGTPDEPQGHVSQEHKSLELDLVTTERKVIIELRKHEKISDDVLHLLEHELDLTESRLLPANAK